MENGKLIIAEGNGKWKIKYRDTEILSSKLCTNSE